jgi:hypothetical protein
MYLEIQTLLIWTLFFGISQAIIVSMCSIQYIYVLWTNMENVLPIWKRCNKVAVAVAMDIEEQSSEANICTRISFCISNKTPKIGKI